MASTKAEMRCARTNLKCTGYHHSTAEIWQDYPVAPQGGPGHAALHRKDGETRTNIRRCVLGRLVPPGRVVVLRPSPADFIHPCADTA